MKEEGLGWFADIDREQLDPVYRWQPCLQTDGSCHSFGVWFASEAECVAYIREQIVGHGMADEQR